LSSFKSAIDDNRSYLSLRTWDPKQNISPKEVASIAASGGISESAHDHFKPIEEAAGMSVNNYYAKFADPAQSACLEVASNLWNP